MKKITVLFFSILTLSLTFNACAKSSHESAQSSKSKTSQTTSHTKTVKEKQSTSKQKVVPKSKSKTEDEFATIDQFINLYNGSASTPITDITDMDIHGSDYQTEFRLHAYDNAVGKKGTIAGSPISIVNYGNFSNDCIRIYVTAASDDIALEIYTTTIHIFDSTITDEDIMKELDSASIYLGENGCIVGYVQGRDIMLDCTKIKFTN